MNSILTRAPVLADFSEKLLREPYFQDDSLSLYSDVSVPCVAYEGNYHICASNPCSDRERYRQVCFDLLVCWEDSVLLAVCFDEGGSQHTTMFSTYLHGLDYLRCPLLGCTDADLEALYQQVTEMLRFFTEYQLINRDYSLKPIEIPEDLPTLRQKHFLCSEPFSMFYTRECGLFFRCGLSEEGRLVQTPVTSEAMSGIFFGALRWQPSHEGCTEVLQAALDMPLCALRPFGFGLLDYLEKTLAAARRELGLPENTGISVFADCLNLLRRIDIQLSSPDTALSRTDALSCHRAGIVYVLSEFLSKDVPCLRMPLQRYFEGAAALTGCCYPIWLYTRKIRPHLCNQPEEAFSLGDLVYTCLPYILFSGSSAAVVPSLSAVLTAPILVPKEK